MDIRCRKTKCKFNDRHTCKAKAILVDNKDICTTYEPREDKPIKDESRKMFRDTPNFAPQRDTKKMLIQCEKKCVLNKDGRCIANGITINDIKSLPKCMTVVEK